MGKVNWKREILIASLFSAMATVVIALGAVITYPGAVSLSSVITLIGVFCGGFVLFCLTRYLLAVCRKTWNVGALIAALTAGELAVIVFLTMYTNHPTNPGLAIEIACLAFLGMFLVDFLILRFRGYV